MQRSEKVKEGRMSGEGGFPGQSRCRVLRDELHRVRRREASRADEFERMQPSRNPKPWGCSKGVVFSSCEKKERQSI